MDYKLEIELEQQSPIIHFQYNQTGATLRASEVKPKLDRFLYNKLKKDNNISQPDIKKWVLNQSNNDKSSKAPAFNYKMKIIEEGSHSVYNEKQMPKIYYGNMGNNNSTKAYCIKSNCKIIIICFIPELLDKISSLIEEFFIVTNFGRMSNKGFGSYIVKSINSEKTSKWKKPDIIIKSLFEESGSQNCYFFSNNNSNMIFDDIQKLYQLMKSGYNYNKCYHRSFLFEYFHQNNIGNEKAYIKQKGLTPCDENGKPVKHPNNSKKISENQSTDYRFVRALLGLTDHMEYISKFIYDKEKEKWKPDSKSKSSIKIESKEDTIERIPSPIFFKIINNTVYIVAKRIDKRVFNKTFTFTGNNKSKDITTPEMFDVDDFLKYFFKEYAKACETNPGKKPPAYKIKGKISKANNNGIIMKNDTNNSVTNK